MMSLVAYDNSSGSESEENDEPQAAVKLNATTNSVGSKKTIVSINSNFAAEPSPSGELFTTLPQPRVQDSDAVEEEQDEFLQKKEKITEKPQKRIKIKIPALPDYDSDDDEPVAKKPKQQSKASGLFALLPAPKVTPISTTSFVPNVLQKKANKPVTKPVKKQLKTKAQPVETTDVTTTNDDSDSNDDEDIVIPETYDDETWQQVCGKKKPKAAPAVVPEDTSVIYFDSAYNVESAPEVSQPYNGLDNQAFKELVGSRKRMKEKIELIDIHEDEIRPDREEWLKSLTDPNCEPLTVIKDPVNTTCKAKNHITALAQKALANDKELQMRWSESRYNRKQTQAKYGF